MNTNLRALIFGATVAAALTITLDTVTAAEQPVEVVRLDTVQVIAHRDAFDANGDLKVQRLAPVLILAHKNVE